MEGLRMDYRFTAILIIMLTLLALFGGPAHSKNEYLNNGYNSCNTGSFDVRIETQEGNNKYNHYSSSNNYNSEDGRDSLSFTYRHFLGSACTKEFKKTQQENIELKQQLELMKMCGKVNKNPTLKYNPNFHLIVMKCSGIVIPENKSPEGSLWDELKDDYKKENPDVNLMGDKFITNKNKLVIPKYLTEDTDEEIILPVPKD